MQAEYEYRDEHCLLAVRQVDYLLDEEAFSKWLPLVSEERQAKALRFKHAAGRALSLGVALLFDEMLRERGLRERDLQYIIGEHGKPSLAGHPEIHFSFSHSGHAVACAIGDRELGIDIQHRVKVNDGLVRRVCSDEEILWLDAGGEEGRPMRFVRLWTLKESWFKAMGTGITDDYPSFDLTESQPRLTNKGGDFRFHEFGLEEMGGALCVRL